MPADMPANNSLHAFLYCSTLAAQQPISVVGDIVKAAREKNARLGLTGVLIFDGQRFCQYLEGNAAAISDMLQNICLDPRHTDVIVQFHGPQEGPRHFQDWAIAYAELEEPIALDELMSFEGEEALLLFHQLLPSLDYC